MAEPAQELDTARERDLAPVRVALAVTASAALLAVAAAGMVSGLVALVGVAAHAALASPAVRRSRPLLLAARVLATLVVLGAGLWAALQPATSDPLAAVRDGAGLLLLGLGVLHAATWRTRRDVAAGLLAVAGLLLLAVSGSLRLSVLVPVVIGWTGVIATLVLATRTSVVASVPRRLIGPRGRVFQGLVLPVLVAVAAAAGLFVLLPGGDSPRLQADAGFGGPAFGLGGEGSSGSSRSAAGYTSGQLDMRSRGDLPDTPLTRVTAGAPDLWRGAVYDQYDGRQWTSSTGGDEESLLAGPPYVVDTANGDPVRRARVEILGETDGTLWSPGRLLRVDTPEPVMNGAFLGLRAFDDDYEIEYALGASRSGPPGAEPRWRQLPAGTPERVHGLAAELATGAGSRAAVVGRVADHLRRTATYRLDSPVPRPGEDAVDRFLFVDRTGFCEQFAAAGVVLLRSAGIPARLVTGLGYADPPRDGTQTFRVSDLHAWVEWWDGSGWVAAEMTPPGALDGVSLERRALEALQRLVAAVPGGLLGIAAGLAALVVGLVLLLVRRRRRAPAARAAVAAGPPAARPALAAFLRLDRRLVPSQRARRPAESLREMRDRLDLPDEPAAAFEVVEQEVYGASPPADAARAAAALDAVALDAVALDDVARDPVALEAVQPAPPRG